jgi:endo-1,4-beta-xylanase
LENHVTNLYRPSQADVSETMRRFVALGLDVAVTEMDVKTDSGGTWADKLDLQRQVFTDSAKACRLQFQCRSFSTWGISDKYSWLGAANAPLLFDVNMKAKPAFAPVKDWIRRP